jgi:hypothetical protein
MDHESCQDERFWGLLCPVMGDLEGCPRIAVTLKSRAMRQVNVFLPFRHPNFAVDLFWVGRRDQSPEAHNLLLAIFLRVRPWDADYLMVESR